MKDEMAKKDMDPFALGDYLVWFSGRSAQTLSSFFLSLFFVLSGCLFCFFFLVMWR